MLQYAAALNGSLLIDLPVLLWKLQCQHSTSHSEYLGVTICGTLGQGRDRRRAIQRRLLHIARRKQPRVRAQFPIEPLTEQDLCAHTVQTHDQSHTPYPVRRE